ncbi:hypothetical protein ACTXJ8_14175 [Corynebacterium variabile]|uniref:hypothetical protein n=1 Tax=Corynebacterium variabile TaxID=1727 RepID=UPI003FCFB595
MRIPARRPIINNMPSADFTTALARVDRAVTHREELWAAAAAHIEIHPLVKDFDIRPDMVRSTVQAATAFPVEVSVIFGEWLYNLRAALDSLLYELAVEDTQKNPPTAPGSRQYPIIADATTFSDKSKRALTGLNEWTRTGIESTQPYHVKTGAKGHALWWLNELARMDRHRRHHLFEWRVIDLQSDPNPDKFLPYHRMCTPSQAFVTEQAPLELVAFPRRPCTPLVDTDLSVSFAVQPDIPSWVQQAVPGFGAEARLDQRMDVIETCVRKTIELFRDHLPQRTPWNAGLVNIDM